MLKSDQVHQSDSLDQCFTIVDDARANRERIHTLAYAVGHLRDYRVALRQAELLGAEHTINCPAMARRFAEQSEHAELVSRVLAKTALESLNDLRDFGHLERALRAVGSRWNEGRTDSIVANALDEALLFMGKFYTDIDTSFLRDAKVEVAKHLSDRRVKIASSKASLDIRFAKIKGGEGHVTIPFRPSGATLGRIGVRQFFSPDSPLALGVIAFDPLSDCHHLSRSIVVEKVRDFDVYRGTVGSLALLRESMYHHVRRVEELGVSHVQGGAFIGVILAIVALVIGLVLGLTGKASVQICSKLPDGTTVCAPVQSQQHPLTTDWTDVLIGAAAALVGIVSDDIGGYGSGQLIPTVPILL
jgi:hypothetical protein